MVIIDKDIEKIVLSFVDNGIKYSILLKDKSSFIVAPFIVTMEEDILLNKHTHNQKGLKSMLKECSTLTVFLVPKIPSDNIENLESDTIAYSLPYYIIDNNRDSNSICYIVKKIDSVIANRIVESLDGEITTAEVTADENEKGNKDKNIELYDISIEISESKEQEIKKTKSWDNNNADWEEPPRFGADLYSERLSIKEKLEEIHIDLDEID